MREAAPRPARSDVKGTTDPPASRVDVREIQLIAVSDLGVRSGLIQLQHQGSHFRFLAYKP